MKKFTIYSLKNSPVKIALKLCCAVLIGLIISFPLLAQQPAKSIAFEQSSETAEVEQGNSQSLLEYISTTDNVPVSASLSAAGKTFEIGERKLQPGGTTIEVDITNLSLKPGLYFLKMNSNTKTELIKIIVQ